MGPCSLLRSILLCLVCFRVAYSLSTSADHSETQAATAVQSLQAWLLQSSKAQERNHYSEAAAADRVIDLPGLGQPPKSDLYSGYVTVDEDAGRALFYTFVESSGSSEEDPLVLWLNGGPGCSSLAGGFLSELGPYYPTAGGKLQENPHAWTQVANIVFLESPAFVGWSYSNRTSDRVVGDARTAEDTLKFLLGFLDRFPAFKGRPFWIAGESYGGHYVPNLALEVLDHNRANEGSRINLQGFLVGNAWTDPNIDNEGAVDFWFHHAIISADTKHAFKEACNFSHVGPLLAAAADPDQLSVDPQECRHILESSAQDLAQINIYDVYVDTCQPAARQQEILQLARVATGHPAVLGAHLASALADSGSATYDPCIDNEVETYFNRPEVQQAMHANLTGLPWRWTGCSPLVEYSQRDLFSSMLPKYEKLLKEDLDILVYSGDVDGIVPVTGTRKWIRGLGIDIEQPWRVWHSTTGQVAGRVVEHVAEQGHKFTFATVRNAGHMVPYTQGARAFSLFSHFIHGKTLQ